MLAEAGRVLRMVPNCGQMAVMATVTQRPPLYWLGLGVREADAGRTY